MTLRQIKMLPQVKSVENNDGQYRVTLADGWKVYPHPQYAFPPTPTRFHHSDKVSGIAEFVGRAEKVRPEKPVDMRKLATDLGAELADKIMERRFIIINNMPESERPKAGRPKKK